MQRGELYGALLLQSSTDQGEEHLPAFAGTHQGCAGLDPHSRSKNSFPVFQNTGGPQGKQGSDTEILVSNPESPSSREQPLVACSHGHLSERHACKGGNSSVLVLLHSGYV